MSCQTSPLKIGDPPRLPSGTAAALVVQPSLTPRLIASVIIRTRVTGEGITPTTPHPYASAAPLPLYSPTLNSAPDSAITEIGRSAGGRALMLQRIGTGSHILLLVGGIHGGYEANTVTLMQQIIAYFTAHPAEIPPQTALLIVPVANPDGLEYGEIPRGRFNDNGVDLNRNWGCEWSPDAYWRDEHVNAGIAPMSEPETQALSALIQAEKPAAALFYHSAAGGIYAGSCGGDHGSAALAKVLGDAADYHYGASFSAYPVTGTASTWADGQGIPSADVELLTHEDSEFDRNLRGVLALLNWISAQS